MCFLSYQVLSWDQPPSVPRPADGSGLLTSKATVPSPLMTSPRRDHEFRRHAYLTPLPLGSLQAPKGEQDPLGTGFKKSREFCLYVSTQALRPRSTPHLQGLLFPQLSLDCSLALPAPASAFQSARASEALSLAEVGLLSGVPLLYVRGHLHFVLQTRSKGRTGELQ